MTSLIALRDVEEAVLRLNQSTRGHNALRVLVNWLDDDGLGLDVDNKLAVLTLLQGAFGPFPVRARDLMRDALSSPDGREEAP